MTIGSNFPADRPRGYATIETETRRVRKALGAGPDEMLPGLRLFESLERYAVYIGETRVRLTYLISDLPRGVEARALYLQASEEIALALSPESYEGLEQEKPRPRFSLAHEIGHAVLHPKVLYRLATIPEERAALARGDFGTLRPFQDVEWQANAFAAALLVPADGLEVLSNRGRLSADVVARTFGVSSECARIRVSVFKERRTHLLSPKK